MTMDFSGGAGLSTNSDTIPKGQLAWAILTVRGVKSSAGGGGYLDCELTIDEGQPYARKKLWEMIGDPNNAGNSEAYRQMGMVAITRILEAGRGAGPNNPAGYQINQYSDLTGLRVAIKVGIEPGTNGHDDKNRVAEWLTPNPASASGHKAFLALQRGEFAPAGAKAAAPAAALTGFSGFGAPAAQPAAQPASSGFGGFGAAAGGTPAAASGFQQPAGNAFAAPQGAAIQQTASGFASPATTTSHSEVGKPAEWLTQAQA